MRAKFDFEMRAGSLRNAIIPPTDSVGQPRFARETVCKVRGE